MGLSPFASRSPRRGGYSRHGTARLKKARRGFPAQVETLESRALLAGVTLAGNVFQQLDVAGLYPNPTPATSQYGYLSPIAGAAIKLDGQQVGASNPDGSYSLSDVSSGPHMVSITPPAGYLGASAQSLSYTLTVPQDTTHYTPPALNFALTPRNAAVVQNIENLVLSHPAEFDSFQQQLATLNSGGTVGQVFKSLYTSSEFQNQSRPIANLVAAFFPGALNVGLFRGSTQLQNLGTAQDATVLGILYSQKFVKKYGDLSKMDNASYIRFMFEHVTKRAPSRSDLSTWEGLLSGSAPLANRGDLPLSLVDSPEYTRAGGSGIPGAKAIADAGASLVYLGVLGREPNSHELQTAVSEILRGGVSTDQVAATLAQIANTLAQSSEYQNLPGFSNTFTWDVATDPIAPAVNPLSRLEKYNPHDNAFDIAVTPGSIKSTASDPVNAYFLVHGWAPGYSQNVLLNSTPGDPQKWWNTTDSSWLLHGVPLVSDVGLAQALTTADPHAEVYAYSWIDQSATSAGSLLTVSGALNKGSQLVTSVDTTGLAVGMNLTAPGIAPGTWITSIPTNGTKGSITLSNPAAATLWAPLSVNVSQYTLPATVTAGSTTVTVTDTSRLLVGMGVTLQTASGPAVPSGTTIASILGPSTLVLSASATLTAAATLGFTGQNWTYLPQNGSTTLDSKVVTGLNTSQVTVGMTVKAPGVLPDSDTVASIDSPTQVTLTAAALASGPTPLTIEGTSLASELQQNLYAGRSESYTQENGLEMASAIREALSRSFFTYGDSHGAGLIHILGHSHGSKVATVAALALQQSNVPVAQLTPLDSPEDGPFALGLNTSLASLGGAQNFNWYYLSRMKISTNSVLDSRTSTNSTFVDNPFSYQGVGSALNGFNLQTFDPGSTNDLSSIVDVELHPEVLYGALSLSAGSGALGTIFGSHGYPPPWYGSTGTPGTTTGLGWSPLTNPQAPPTSKSYEQVVINPTGTLTAGSNTITSLSSTAGLVPGMPITDHNNANYIPPLTTITAVDPSAKTLQLSKAVLHSASNDELAVLKQLAVAPATLSTFTPTAQTPLAYASEYQSGQVSDTGSSITLSVGPHEKSAIDAVTFTPQATNGFEGLGAGLDLQVAFSDVPAGEQVELVVWINGAASLPQLGGTTITGSTLGHMSIPLLTMNSAETGSAPQTATLSLGQYLKSYLLLGPFNAVNSANPSTNIPTLGFTLVGDVTRTTSVTVSAMNQFAVGVGVGA
jgi:hypothetical protein